MEDNVKSAEIKAFIERKKKIKRRKKIIYYSISLTTILIIIFLKAPCFNIKEFEMGGVNKLDKEILESQLEEYINENIFLTSNNEVINKLMINPYIKDVEVKRNSVNKIELNIEKEEIIYYIKNDDNYILINNKFKVIDILKNLPHENMIEIVGITAENYTIDEVIISDSIHSNILNDFNIYLKKENNSLGIEMLDLTDILNIKSRSKNVDLYFGESKNLQEKFNKIYTIMNSQDLKLENGYISVAVGENAIIKNNNEIQPIKEENIENN